MAEPHLAAGPAGDALGDRRTAILLERGRVEHAIADRLALLALEDTFADFLGVKLQADIRLAWPHAIPLPIAHHAAARQNAPVDAVIVLHDRPPADRERRGRAPVHGPEPHPILRDGKRRDHVPLARTNSLLPDARSCCLYASTSMYWLLSTFDGMNTRSSPVTGSWMMRLPKGAGSM